MKKEWIFSIVLFLIASFLCPPQWAQAQNAKEKNITMEFKNESLPSAFKRLEKASGYKILFTYDDVSRYTVTASVKNQTLEGALKAVIGNHPLEYGIEGKYVNVTSKHIDQKPRGGVKKTYTVTGTVVDRDGLPLPGAAVQIKGTALGTATDLDGKYVLELGSGDIGPCVLLFSYIGMKAEEVHVTPGSKELIALSDVILSEDFAQMEEVVVTGIFQRAKESYTGAVSTVSKEQLQMFKGQNLVQTLRNIDPSLNIPMNNAFGSNPNALPQMTIRGSSSLPMSVKEFNEQTKQSVNTPLIIMDGFETTLERLMDYNDEEIESINILKDASATAIYGSRGSNGVIVVQTKKPEPGKLKVTLQAGLNWEIPDLSSYDLLNAADKLELERIVGLYKVAGAPGSTSEYEKRYYSRLKDVLSGVNTDWLSQPLHNGVGQRYNLRLEGGSDEFRWGTSISYNDTQGAMKGSARRVFNGDITLMYTVNNLRFRNSTTIGNTNSAESKYGSFDTYVVQQPYNKPYDESGALNRYFDGFGPENQDEQNPLYDVTLNSFDKENRFEVTNNFSVDWTVLPELTVRGQFGITTLRNTSDYFLPGEHSYFNKTEYRDAVGALRKGQYTYGTEDYLSMMGHVTVNYAKTFAEKHLLNAGLDVSLTEDSDRQYEFVAEGFGNDDLSFLANALQYEKDGAPTGSKIMKRSVGVTGNVNYIYDNRYFIDASFRMDGSSQFGSNKRYAPFWSVGLGWNLHNEKFMQEQTVLNKLRLRGSVGETGTVDFSQAQVETMYQFTPGDRYLSWHAAHLQGLGNPDLTWQKTREINVGLEFGLWSHRIQGEFDVYSKTTSNLLSLRDLPLSMGFGSFFDNVGEVKNTGFEASLSAYIIRDNKRDLNWMVSGKLVYNKNEITKLSDAILAQNETYLKNDEVDVANLFYVGRPQNAIYAVRSLGIDASTGKEIFLDKNGNATYKWSASDKVYLGPDATYASPYRGNASTMLKWKDFTFNISFGYQWGGKTYNQTLVDRVEVSNITIRNRNVDSRVFTDRWQKPGDVAFFKGYSNESTRASSRFVMDDNWFEIQSIGVQYRWANETLRKIARLQSVTFGLNMSDVWHFSNIKYERGTQYPFARNVKGTITLLF